MKYITLREAFILLQQCSAIIIDNVVTYPILAFDEIQYDPDAIFVEFVWEDGYDEFGVTIFEGCGDITFDGTNMFLKDEDEDEHMITLLVPMKAE